MAERRPKAFVIHGHDDRARLELCRFLVAPLDIEPVVLAEQPALGRTVIEQLEIHLSACDVAVAILTRDDRISKGAEEGFQARQNVIFEIGFACASLGRDRVCLLYQQGVELPSDLSGVVYYRFVHSVLETELSLIVHFRELGLPVFNHSLDNSILVVDDDLTETSPIVQQLRTALKSLGEIKLLNDADLAIKLLSYRRYSACIADLVFRDSEMAGVRIAEKALSRGTPVIMMTGHRKGHLGLVLAELERVGLWSGPLF